jgi:hypothetical protein
MLRFSTSRSVKIGSAGESFERVRARSRDSRTHRSGLGVLDAQLDEVDVLPWTE